MKKILCLDFDGVICDSQLECLITSYVAYHRDRGVAIHNISSVVIPDEIKKLFIKHRYLVRPAWQYIVLMQLLHESETISEQLFNFTCKKLSDNKEKLSKYFFEVRSEWILNNSRSWFQLNPVYLHVKENWEKVIDQKITYFVTNKNYNSVITLLKYHNLNFNKKNIYGKEKIKSKLSMLQLLAQKDNIEPKQIIFVDDSSYYVSKMLSFGFESYLAKWGYEKNKVDKFTIPNKNILNNFGEIIELLKNHEK
jgi:phosphoglycolate phosphatase-like HAD superfamily hydrolase